MATYTPRTASGSAGTPVQIGSSTPATQNITTQGTKTSAGIVNFDPNTGARLATGQSVTVAPGGNTYGSNPISNQSTTTLSSDKSKDILSAQNTTAKYAQGGVTTDPNTGIATTADGKAYQPYQAPEPTKNDSTTSMGGYVGETYYAPGSDLPTDANGKALSTTETSPTTDSILKNLNSMKSSADALTAQMVGNIESQFTTLQRQQEEINAGNNAASQGALFRSGAAQGDAYAQNTQNYQIQQGVNALADLATKKQTAILEAQQAGQNNDFQLMEQKNNVLAGIAKEQAAAGKVLQETIQSAQADARATKLQTDKENATIELYNQGITDPGQLTKALIKSGFPATLKEVNDNVALLSGQGGTGIVGEYNFYKSQAKAAGQVPVDFNTYQNMDANRKVSIAKASAAGGSGGVSAGQVSDALLRAIDGGFIDPNRLNSRTIGIYNQIAGAAVDAVGAHAGAAGETKAITDLATYKSTATRTLGVLESNLPLVENLADKVNTIGSPVLDAYISGKKALLTNDPNVIKYVNSLKTLRAEYAQMLAKGNATTESDKAEAAQAIPAGLSSAGYAALGEQLKLEAHNILQASDAAIAAAKSKSFSNTGGTGADLIQQGQDNPLNLDTGANSNNPLGI